MATARDVAQYIRDKLGQISTIKLEKLVYYCKAWSLVWDEDPLFHEQIQAWANGPVVPELYKAHKGYFFCPSKIADADVNQLTDEQKETIDVVLDAYKDKSPQYLVALTHSEEPWINARRGYKDGQSCQVPITDEAIASYYSRLYYGS